MNNYYNWYTTPIEAIVNAKYIYFIYKNDCFGFETSLK